MQTAGGFRTQDAAPTVSGADYEQEFTDPLETWTVNHNLGKYPLTLVLSDGGLEMDAEIHHVSANQVQVLFSSPTSGRIRCI